MIVLLVKKVRSSNYVILKHLSNRYGAAFPSDYALLLFSNLWKSLRICDGCARAAYRQSEDGGGDSGEEEKKEKWGRRRSIFIFDGKYIDKKEGIQLKHVSSRRIFTQQYFIRNRSACLILAIYCVNFGVNFILQKFCMCKKMTNIRYGFDKNIAPRCYWRCFEKA